jgi:hypothetical protein
VAALNLEMSSWQKEPPCLQVIYFQAQRLLVLSVYHAVRHALVFGSLCCAEMGLWEANKVATALHPGLYVCMKDDECGSQDGDRFIAPTDRD